MRVYVFGSATAEQAFLKMHTSGACPIYRAFRHISLCSGGGECDIINRFRMKHE
jgi:hypothetical protein